VKQDAILRSENLPFQFSCFVFWLISKLNRELWCSIKLDNKNCKSKLERNNSTISKNWCTQFKVVVKLKLRQVLLTPGAVLTEMNSNRKEKIVEICKDNFVGKNYILVVTGWEYEVRIIQFCVYLSRKDLWSLLYCKTSQSSGRVIQD
jgi:hypothetical protein